jgi:N-acetylmuramoyl-L-alanine amidase
VDKLLHTVEWAGKNINNHGSREGVKPFLIVNHVSVGSMTSMLNTFENPANQASSHFAISREGDIVQYVQLDRAAWTQGIVPSRYQAARIGVVREMNCNPNLYSISIEHEGYIDKQTGERRGIDGDLTEAQFWATCWLHRYIKQAVFEQFGVEITLGPSNVVGHFQIDPVRKPNCPGPKFPWARLYAELAIADTMTLGEYEERLAYLQGENALTALVVALAFRVEDLKAKLGGKWGDEAQRKLERFNDVLVRYGFAVEGVPPADRILGLYKQYSQQLPYDKEAFRKLCVIAQEAKNLGLI